MRNRTLNSFSYVYTPYIHTYIYKNIIQRTKSYSLKINQDFEGSKKKNNQDEKQKKNTCTKRTKKKFFLKKKELVLLYRGIYKDEVK